MTTRRSAKARRRPTCPTCGSVVTGPLPEAPRTGFGPAATLMVCLLLIGLTLASGQAAIEAFDPPDRRAAGVVEEPRPERQPEGLDVDARHLGNHELEISASLEDAGQPVTGADIVAFVDMATMPGAHTKGPIALAPVPGRSGAYAVREQMPMVGRYEVRVEVRQPRATTAVAEANIAAGEPAPARYPELVAPPAA